MNSLLSRPQHPVTGLRISPQGFPVSGVSLERVVTITMPFPGPNCNGAHPDQGAEKRPGGVPGLKDIIMEIHVGRVLTRRSVRFQRAARAGAFARGSVYCRAAGWELSDSAG